MKFSSAKSREWASLESVGAAVARHVNRSRAIHRFTIRKTVLGWAVLLLTWPVHWPVSAGESGAGGAINFNRDIRPILSDNCFKCHGFDAKQRRAGLRLDIADGMREPLKSGAIAVVPGELSKSELWRRITHKDDDERMPPMDSGKSLKPETIELIRRWIKQGADYSYHWAFLKPQNPAPPAVNDESWPANPIDRFILARLNESGLEPSHKAEHQVLIRRLSFDLRGLPPSPAEVVAFLADGRVGAYEQLVDRWLASPRYGELMAQDWLDAARYADTAGHAADVPRTMWLYRDWVIDALNRNMPFDQFTVEQLAGDMLPKATQTQKIATGFHRNSMQALGSNPRKEEFRIKGIVDRLDTTGRVWLGLSLACAECHDHKHDPVSTREYYQIFSIFNNVPHYGEKFEVHGPRLDVLPEKERRQRDQYEKIIGETKEALNSMDDSHIAQRQIKWEFNPVSFYEQPHQLRFQGAINEDPWDDLALEQEHSVKDSPWDDGNSLELSESRGAIHVREKISFDSGLTVSIWIKTHSPLADLVSKFDWKAGQRSFVFGIGGQSHNSDYRPGHLYAWISSKSATFEGIELMGSQPVNDGRWHHVALTFRPGKEASLFVDGERDVKAKSKGKVPGHIASCERELVIGAGYQESSTPNAFFYQGLLHDVRIYSRAVPDTALLGGCSNALRQALRKKPDQRNPRQQDLLKAHYQRIDPERKRLLQQIEEAQQSQRNLKANAITAQIMDELPETRDTYIHVRGNFENRGEKVSPGTPAFLPPIRPGKPINRLSFAQWLVDDRNPLTARVTVNRLWAHYFGQGLVSTLDDFGTQAAVPSHPKLLDWLAVEFVESGWDMKAMHRLIVKSATYQQSSRRRPDLAERDPGNRLLAQGSRIRLPAEQVRDNALAISGLLASRIGGPSVYPPQPEGVGEYRDATAGKWENSEAEGRFRRSLYTFWQRTSPYPALTIFDAPSRERTCIGRSLTNTPLQALALLNDPAHIEIANALVRRIIDQFEGSESRLDYAFQLVLGRHPEPDEKARFKDFEHMQRKNGANDDLQVWILMVQVLMNLDETITKE
jgi:hypothetical protein